MKILSIAFLTILIDTTFAQKFSSELEAMVDTENAFAKYSKEKNTRDAFLLYLTDSTVLFERDGPVKGRKQWEERSPNNSLLFWYPVFVGISNSGDLGFSTGPWEWSPTKEAAKPEAHGYYATLWQKFPDGWKMALDMGGLMPGPQSNIAPLHASNPRGKPGKTKKIGSMLDVDKIYIDKLNAQGIGYIAENFSADALMIRSGAFPDYFPFKNLNETRSNFKFTPAGGDVSSAKDLGYTYGRVQFETKKDNATAMTHAGFFRVWKLEDGEWKIVLDVIGAEN
jgi:ketosteroid isomerase-like protein